MTMNSREILTLKTIIFNHLSNKELKDAFENLSKLAVHTQDWRMSEKMKELENNYKYMLHYMFEGTEDPHRGDVYRGVLKSIYELTEDVVDELSLFESSNYFYERLRLDALKTETINDYFRQLKEITSSVQLYDLLESGDEKRNRTREAAVKRERIGVQLFNAVYVSNRAGKDSLQDYLSFINSPDIASREKSLFISALTLNILHRFDAVKIEVLLEASQSDVLLVKGRALVGLIIALHIYSERLPLYPELNGRLEVLGEDIMFRKSVLSVLIQLIRARDTERISKKVTEEIIPQMMKFSNIAGKKISMEDLMGETDFMDKNPDWQKELEDSGLSKKLQEYSELQMEGADVFLSTFANLKNFSFFTEMANWFLPFDKNYSEVAELFPEEKKHTLLNIAIADSGHMCNSDKYSFCLSLSQIPTSQREMMLNRMGAESEEVKRMQKEAQAMNPAIDEEVISNQYIQDLYRFYKLHNKRNDFIDIFKLELNFYQNSAIAPLINEQESMQKIANYCFSKNFFEVALSIFQLIADKENCTETIWQKIGYCHQMLNNSALALEAYLHSDLLVPDQTWTLRRIAHLYRSLNEPQKALEYYNKIAQLNPDNLSVELNIGHCLLELKDYEKALNCFFKVEMLDGKGIRAFRPIAWTAFLLKKYDVSEKYFERILADQPTMHDYLNAGHLHLVQHNSKQALAYYRDAAILSKDFEQLKTLILADKESLLANGIDENIFPFLFDQIKYMLE